MSTTKQGKPSKLAVRPRRMYGHYSGDDAVGIFNPKKTNIFPRPMLVLDLSSESVEAMRDKISTECAVLMSAAYMRGQYGMPVCTDDREDYQGADLILAAIGIKATKGKRAITDAAKGE